MAQGYPSVPHVNVPDSSEGGGDPHAFGVCSVLTSPDEVSPDSRSDPAKQNARLDWPTLLGCASQTPAPF
ncbi:hypothetical protein GCM10022247_71710 [Allokutzneria multivorans]|uniref:Uncharacterized protein n=1 Tax=Allokutzneria multivorans TaxID=1142134 RepID=A0ABP7U3Y1_9PSEU